MFTPMDPLFVILASTWCQRERSMSLYDLLSRDHNAWWLQLAACTHATVEKICDVQSTGSDESLDNLYVKANVAKILKWLSAKVSRVAKTLAQQASEAKAMRNSGNFDAKFALPGQPTEPTASSDSVAIDASQFNRDAIELLADYLPEDVTDLLFKQFKCVALCLSAYCPRA